jgi:hypothetical protein
MIQYTTTFDAPQGQMVVRALFSSSLLCLRLQNGSQL